MPSTMKETATSMDLETQVMDFLAKVESIDTMTRKIDIRTRRIEQMLLYLCDQIAPGHPEIARIKQEIEQEG